MGERNKHLFEFRASDIAAAAKSEAKYHGGRLDFWRSELETATAKVTETAKVKVDRMQVTGGWRPQVTVDYGDPAAYARMGEAAAKLQSHLSSYDRFTSDAELYGTQGDRAYQLDGDDVAHFRLNGRQREE